MAEEHQLPLIYDMGSGLMTELADLGIDEPTVKDSLRAGADIVLFSGRQTAGRSAGRRDRRKKGLYRTDESPSSRQSPACGQDDAGRDGGHVQGILR